MKLLEALIQVRDKHLVISHPDGFKVTRIGDTILFKRDDESWRSIAALFNDEDLQDDWEIYEEKKGKGFCVASILIHCDDTGVSIGSDLLAIPAFDEKTAHDWQKALATFFELKSHPLAVPATEEETQWQIDGGCMDTEDNYFIQTKRSRLSPCFKSSHDAQKCLEDIGESRLLHMFRTFQGIYE